MDQDDMSARIAALSNLSQDELRARFSAHPLTTTADELRDAASAHEPGTLADAREALARMAWAATDAPSRCACYAPDVRADVARAYAALTAALPQDADDDQRVQRAVDELAERFAQGLTSDAMPSHHVNAAIACIDAGEIAQAIHWLELWWKGAQIAGDREAKPATTHPTQRQAATSTLIAGEILADELAARQWTPSHMAALCGLPEQAITAIIAGGPITPSVAARIGQALGTSAQMWLALNAHSPDTLHLSPPDIETLEAALDREPRVVPELAALIDRYGDPKQVGDSDR